MDFNTGCLTDMTFSKVDSNCGIFKQDLENRPNKFHSIGGSKNVAMAILKPVTFEGSTLWQ